jgi:hypothetical protein
MPIRDAQFLQFPTFARGIDNTSEVDSKDILGTLSVALNADLVEDSLVAKRFGYTGVNSAAWSTYKIRSGIEYKKTTGTPEIVVYGEESAITGTSGRLGTVTSSGVTNITTGLVDGSKPTLLQLRNLLFYFSSGNNFIYTGTTTRQIGIDAPIGAPTFSEYATGDLNTSGSYYFAYTYYNSTTGAESTPSDPSEAIATGTTEGATGITLTLLAGSSTTANKIRIYRTTSGGNTFYYDGEVDITATSYTSTGADSALGDELELDNSRLPENAKYAVALDNRIFTAGFASNPNRVHYSKIGIRGPMPESFQALDFTDCNLNDGDSIVGLAAANSTTIVIKERSVGRLVRIDAQISGLERTGSAKYLYEEISNQTTATSQGSVVALDNIVIWIGKDEIYGTDGLQIFRLGRRIRKTLNTLNYTQAYKWSAINKTGNQQLIFSVCRSGQTEPDFQLVGHYRYFKSTGELAFTFYSPGTNTTTHPGIRAGCMFDATENNIKVYYFGNSNGDGKVYKMDSATSDNSLGIYFDVRTPWLSASRGARKKTFHSVYMQAAGSAGATYNLTHTFEKNRQETVVETATSALTGASTGVWNTGTWNNFTWGGVEYVPVKFFPGTKAYFGRYGFSNTNADQPVVISGLEIAIQMEEQH